MALLPGETDAYVVTELGFGQPQPEAGPYLPASLPPVSPDEVFIRICLQTTP